MKRERITEINEQNCQHGRIIRFKNDIQISTIYYCYFFTFGDDDALDHFYYGCLENDEIKVPSLKLVNKTLERLPDRDIYFRLARAPHVTVAPEPTIAPGLFLKRPTLSNYIDSVGRWFREEVDALELIAQHPPHPHIVKYHGCRVRRRFITGIVMDDVEGEDLNAYSQLRQMADIDKPRFMAALESAIHHLHPVVGVAHNDLNPNNIMVDKDGMPVLIDFGSCRRLGDKINAPFGTPGWSAPGVYEHCISQPSNDLFALEKPHGWLDKPELGTSLSSTVTPRCQASLWRQGTRRKRRRRSRLALLPVISARFSPNALQPGRARAGAAKNKRGKVTDWLAD